MKVRSEKVQQLQAPDFVPLPTSSKSCVGSTKQAHRICCGCFRRELNLTATGLRRLAHVAADSQAAILYSDYFDQQADGAIKLHPLIDYQPGSLRDDFDFGQVVLLSRAAVQRTG